MVIYNRRRVINMDFVVVNEHIEEWCVVNGYRIVESHKLKNRQIEIVDIRYGYCCVFTPIPKKIWIC